MVFHKTFVLALFHDKECCTCINLFPCFFVRFICNEFSIKLVKIDQEVDLTTCLASGATHKSHMRSTCLN